MKKKTETEEFNGLDDVTRQFDKIKKKINKLCC